MEVVVKNREDILMDNMKKATEAEVQLAIGIDDDYGKKVDALIRERYSMSQEIAINRQKDSKPQEWKEYYDFCEDCKRKAKDVS